MGNMMATRSDYDKKSYQKHKEKRKAHNKEYYQREEVKAKSAERVKQKYQTDEEYREYCRKYKLEWYHNNKDKHKERTTEVRRSKPLLYWQYKGMVNRAKKNNLPCDFIDYDDFINHLGELPEECPVTGITMLYGLGDKGPGKAHIDKLIPSLGYVKGNIAMLSAKGNQLKQDNTVETLEALLKYMRDTHYG